MFCSKCGKELPDGSRFCGTCGAKNPGFVVENMSKQDTSTGEGYVERTSSSKDKIGFTKFKKNNIKKFIGIVVVAIMVVVVALALKGNISFLKNDNAYVYLSDGKYELITNLDKEITIEIAVSKSDSIKSNLVAFSPDGKYVYYFTKYDSISGTGSLCRAEYDKLKEGSSKNNEYIEIIAANVALGFRFLDDGTVTYENGEGALYYYNGSESTRIAKSVSSYYTDGSERVAYVTGDYSEGYTLYGVTLSEIENKKKLASNFYYILNSTNFDNILYVKQEDDYSQTLYVVGFEKESSKIGENIRIISSTEDKVYFTAKNGSTLNLYDFVVDNVNLVEDGIVEPDKEKYATPLYGYIKLNKSSNANDYEGIYTSCTNAASFYKSWYSYRSLEYAAENASTNKDVYQAFVDKYISQEDENGFILVTDEIKSDLINLANTCGQGYEGEWLELCFGRVQDGVEYDEEAYNQAYAEYNAVITYNKMIKSMREDLQAKENAYPVKTLYCYDKGNLSAINENILNAETYGESIVYNTVDSVIDTVNLTDITSVSDVTRLFSINKELQNYVVPLGGTIAYQMSVNAAEVFAELDNSTYAELYFINDLVYMSQDYGEVYVANINEGVIGEFSVAIDEAAVLAVDESAIYYVNDAYEFNDYWYCDVHYYNKEKSKCLAQDILYDTINIYSDGVILAYTGYRSNSGYELTMIDSNGKTTIIGDDIKQYIRVDESTLLYISDGDLYIYDGEDRSIIQNDVEWLWSRNLMEIQQSFGDYNYDGIY